MNRSSELSQVSPKGSHPGAELRSPRLSPKKSVTVEKKKLVGTGGSGCKVWKAKIDGWICCVKELPVEMCSAVDIETFEQEITILQNLPAENPNLIRYLGFQKNGNCMQLFMTLYDGTLFDLIQSRNHKPFSEKEIVCISCQLLEALATLHSKRLIHRDVKSMNIYYEEGDDKTFVMGDFGESKIIPRKKRTSTITGTDRWIAPEVLMAEYDGGYSFKADVWSFGMVIYEMMTLQLPYFHLTRFSVPLRIMEGVLPVLSDRQTILYKNIIPIWNECLKLDPDMRISAENCLNQFKYLLLSISS